MKTWKRLVPFIVGVLLFTVAASPIPRRAGEDPGKPTEIVKLIFIHHSTGQNWLADDYGNLAQTLGANNYFVSDTNYNWGPHFELDPDLDTIGDHTDIPNWTEWFASSHTPTYMAALYSENHKTFEYTRTLTDPTGENEIVMFKSCFPNSNLDGNPTDPPNADGWLTVGHAKYVYNEILEHYFQVHPEKMFVVITAPPVQDGTYAANARAFNTWLMDDWLDSYTGRNVFVFDFYNVLTDPDAHHRYNSGTGEIEHTVVGGHNTLYYDSGGDDHPNVPGSQKATDEFVPLLNIFYHRWKQNAHIAGPRFLSPPAGTLLNDSTPTVSWEAVANAVKYDVVFATDLAFAAAPHTVTDPAFAFSSPLANGKYYWRVRGYNAVDEPGDWSAARSFTIDVTPPAAPAPQLPANGASVRGTPTFRWQAVSGAVLYRFQLDNNADFSSPLVSAEQRTLSRKPAGSLRGTYSWRVQAQDAAGNWGNWSAVFTVTIVPPR